MAWLCSKAFHTGNSKQSAIDARLEIAMKKQAGLLSRRDCLKLAGSVTLSVPLARIFHGGGGPLDLGAF